MQKPGRFARLGVGTLTAAVLWTSGCAPSVSETSAGTIVVGGKNFTEQLLVAEMTRLVLAANGFTVDLRGGMGSDVVRAAQENGQNRRLLGVHGHRVVHPQWLHGRIAAR